MKTRTRVVSLAYVLLFIHCALAQNVNSHPPITIQSNSDFTSCACVTGGMGTQANPYIIGPWAINTGGGVAVFVDGTNVTASFELFNLKISGTSTGTDTGIVLNHINPSRTQTIVAEVYGVQTSIQNANVGILVENSSYVVLDGAGENRSGPGIRNSGAGTLNGNLSGAMDVESSTHVSVKGWQFSANGLDHAPDYIGFNPGVQYWGVGGVRFFGVTASVIDHNSANNDTNLSYGLFNSSSNQVTYNTADYPYTHNILVADGSSYNTISNNDTGTGDYFNIMVADPLPGTATLKTYGASHDNVISNNISHSAGPTGHELSDNIVPAFLGGIVVLNGTYNNQILNNQSWANTGADLVWAQAVPNSGTPIGVSTYPPAVNCNVTASEGGGVGKLNGNVWKGNTYQSIVPCLPAQ
ncbi:MAG TPA: hypothetical protein VEV41_15505 [Terriglobales bacterium]|jgi:hypothetical protein|nr:hypothetical protein [Terriglobales bacterium]